MVELYKAHGLQDLAPYMCLWDWASREQLGMAVRRPSTLSEGDFCEFHYIGPTKNPPSGWPPELLEEWKIK